MKEDILDARRLLCPLPVIRAQERIAGLSPGDHLEVICTDPGALKDIPAWCRLEGHEVVATLDEGDQCRVLIEVGPRP